MSSQPLVRVLDDVVVTSADGNRVKILARQQRTILTALALNAPESVTVDELIDVTWPVDPPKSARAAVHNNIRRLRTSIAALGPDVIETVGPGYRLRLPPEDIDVGRLRALTQPATPAMLREWLHSSLAAWDGTMRAEIADAEALVAEMSELASQRVSALEQWCDLCLADGIADRPLPLLNDAIRVDPLRESLRARLMLALHASGRTADALAEYRRARNLLVSQMGVEPGHQLRAAHARVLALPADPTPTRPVPAQLPAVGPMSGRTDQLRALDDLLAEAGERSGSVVICGPAGVGKSTLALTWARAAAERFPDGQLFAQLRGFDPAASPASPATVLRSFLGSLGVASDDVPADPDQAAGLFRSLIAERRLLIVLDNARDAAQVRPLLPSGRGCFTVVTSRHDLAGLATTEGTGLVTLDLLDTEAATELLTRRIGADRMRGEETAAAALVAHCGGLPLALAVVATRLASRPDLTLSRLLEELTHASPLDALDLGEPTSSVRSVLSWSLQVVSAEARAIFAFVGLHPGTQPTESSLASLSCLSLARTRKALAELARAHLVHHDSRGVESHGLVRAYAREQAEALPEAARVAAMARLADHIVHSAFRATRMHFDSPLPFEIEPPGEGVVPELFDEVSEATGWLRAQSAAIDAVAAEMAEMSGKESASWQLARILSGWVWGVSEFERMHRLHGYGLIAASRVDDRHGIADAHHGLGEAAELIGRPDEADRHLAVALETFNALDDALSMGDVFQTQCRLFDSRGQQEAATEACEQALAMAIRAKDVTGQATALNNLACLRAKRGDHGESLELSRRALALYRGLGDRVGKTFALDTLGEALTGLGRVAEAAVCYAESCELGQELANHRHHAQSLAHLGLAYLHLGDQAGAQTALASARASAGHIEIAAIETLAAGLRAR